MARGTAREGSAIASFFVVFGRIIVVDEPRNVVALRGTLCGAYLVVRDDEIGSISVSVIVSEISFAATSFDEVREAVTISEDVVRGFMVRGSAREGTASIARGFASVSEDEVREAAICDNVPVFGISSMTVGRGSSIDKGAKIPARVINRFA